MKVYGSIVLYNTDFNELKKAVDSFFLSDIEDKKLFLIDNSPNDELNICSKLNNNIEYVFNNSNLGFGAGHNIAIKKSIDDQVDYHVVINPDISSTDDIIGPLVSYLNNHSDVGMIMPKIINNDGSLQHLPKLLPTPFGMLLRKIKYPKNVYRKFIDQYELRSVSEDTIYNAPVLSGCFSVFRVCNLKEIGLYDEKFFMYFEDWDISRRMHQISKTIYYPRVKITHNYESGANHNFLLFKIFVKSAIMYFNKWGWFFDLNRKKINRKTLLQFTDKYGVSNGE